MTGPGSGIGPRERWWLVVFLALGSAYFAFLVTERVLDLLGGLGTILLILFLAWLLAFVMSPLVAALEERVDLPRPAIVIGSYLLALVVFGFAVFYTGAAMTQQVTELARNYPPPSATSSASWPTGSAGSSSAVCGSTSPTSMRAPSPRWSRSAARSSSRRRTSPASRSRRSARCS